MNESKAISVPWREFLKVAAGAVGTAAVVTTGLGSSGLDDALDFGPEEAFAAAAFSSGTYTVMANLYVAAADTPIGKNAYVTNSGNSPTHKPTSPVSDNATLVVDADGKKTLTVPVVNNTFGVRSIASSSTDGTVLVLSTSDTTWTAPSFPLSSTPYSTRISSITFDVTNFAGALRWPISAPARNMRHSRYIGATRRGTCIWRSIYPMLNRANCCKGSRAACSVRVGNLCILTFE